MKANGIKRPGDVEIAGFWFTLLVVWPATAGARVYAWIRRAHR